MTKQPPKSLLESALDILREAASGNPYASQAQLARATGESEANISRWLNGSATPTLRKLEPVLTALGVRIVLPYGAAARTEAVGEQSNTTLPLKQRAGFMALPMLGEVGADKPLPALIQKPEDWLMVQRELAPPSAVVLKVSEHERSMLPRICPGDMLLVDTAKKIPISERDVYLVREPKRQRGGHLLRRVVVRKNGRQTFVLFYADNTAEGYAPLLYDLSHYENGDIHNAVKGKVILRLTSQV